MVLAVGPSGVGSGVEVGEVVVAGGVEGVLGGADRLAVGQDGVLVAVVAGEVDREAPQVGRALIPQAQQPASWRWGRGSEPGGPSERNSDARPLSSSPVMTIELARFTIHPDAEPQLLAERPAMVEALHRRFPGCLAAYLTKEDDGSWLDVVLWRSREDAQEAADAIASIPACASWFRHVAESGGLRHVEVVAAWAGSGHPGS